jgi:hypothetical protein
LTCLAALEQRLSAPAQTAHRDTIVGRLSRGIAHRINNVATALMIATQELAVPNASNSDDIAALVTQSLDRLTMLNKLFTSAGPAGIRLKDLLGLAQSVVNGYDHRVVLLVDAPEADIAVPGPQSAARDALLLVLLALHTAIGHSGTIRLSTETSGNRIAISAHAALAANSGECSESDAASVVNDMAVARRLLQDGGGDLAVETTTESAVVTLLLGQP